MDGRTILLILMILVGLPVNAFSQAAVIEVSCPSCGFSERFVQGARASERARNVQHVIVVCERTGQIRSIKVPIDPRLPVEGEPLVARQVGTGMSKLLDAELPKFIIPGNTCPLFPLAAYLEANVCPIDGSPGVRYGLVGYHHTSGSGRSRPRRESELR
jgi:RNase P subunit RPR2